MFMRIPETDGIYQSVLHMSISRGDASSAILAFSYLAKHNSPLLLSQITFSSLSIYSCLPEEVCNIHSGSAKTILKGMLNTEAVDKRALSLAIMSMRGFSDKKYQHSIEGVKKYVFSGDKYSNYLRLLLRAAVEYLEDEECPEDYFSTLAEKDPVPAIIIPWEYYLGPDSWIRPYVLAYLESLGESRISAKDMLDFFEYYQTREGYVYDYYWNDTKEFVFGGKFALREKEERWKATLKPKVQNMVSELMESRLPVL
jgi:hypothetical protein